MIADMTAFHSHFITMITKKLRSIIQLIQLKWDAGQTE